GRHSSHILTFCQYIPDLIQLIYAGYLSSLPEEPHTAFFILLVQMHHQIWQNSAVSTQPLFNGNMDFINKCSHLPLYAHTHNGKKAKWDLCKPFSHSVDLLWHILHLQEGLNLSVLDCCAETHLHCFGPAFGEVKQSPAVPNFLVSLDANFQQQYYMYLSGRCFCVAAHLAISSWV
ncbi:hypothetical protein CROQUDRAFT_703895, partial [Cronartium quercuum f. sp. fusiforme G11]